MEISKVKGIREKWQQVSQGIKVEEMKRNGKRLLLAKFEDLFLQLNRLLVARDPNVSRKIHQVQVGNVWGIDAELDRLV